VGPGLIIRRFRERKVSKNRRAVSLAAADHRVDGWLITLEALAIPAALAGLEKSLLDIL
jgi:hypothetical protein